MGDNPAINFEKDSTVCASDAPREVPADLPKTKRDEVRECIDRCFRYR
jgi:hypothetical protein